MMRRPHTQPVQPTQGRPDLTVLIATDLHVDFVGHGPMAGQGADGCAAALIARVARYREPKLAFERAASRGDETMPPTGWTTTAVVAVEGPTPRRRGPRHFAGLPPHAAQPVEEGLLDGIDRTPDCPWAWGDCPAGGGDVLDLGWEAKGAWLPLRRYITWLRPGRVEIAGLSVDHGGLAVAEAMVAERLVAGDAVTVLAGSSTFLDLAATRPRLDRLAGAGVHLDWSRWVDRNGP